MGKKIAIIIIAFIILLSRADLVKADNLIDASAQILKDSNNTGSFVIDFKTILEIPVGGNISVIFPKNSDLDRAILKDVSIRGCSDSDWKIDSIDKDSINNADELIILRSGTSCATDSQIIIQITLNQISTPPNRIRIKTQNASKKILDNIFIKVSDVGGVTVSAQVGQATRESLVYGYTSPKALVKLEGIGLTKETHANKAGYFEFIDPFVNYKLQEACVSNRDELGRTSSPQCISLSKKSGTIYYIGPILLSPTLSLSKNNYFIDDDIALTGQTIPDTTISLSFFNDRSSSIFDIIKSAYAFALPQLESRSDSSGNFSIVIPSAKAEVLRFFSQTKFKNELSPKSTTLYIRVLPFWIKILNAALVILIILLILGSYYGLKKIFQPYHMARNRAIVLKKQFPLMRI